MSAVVNLGLGARDFYAVYGKNWSNSMLALLGLAPPLQKILDPPLVSLVFFLRELILLLQLSALCIGTFHWRVSDIVYGNQRLFSCSH